MHKWQFITTGRYSVQYSTVMDYIFVDNNEAPGFSGGEKATNNGPVERNDELWNREENRPWYFAPKNIMAIIQSFLQSRRSINQIEKVRQWGPT